ncbi:MAG TPA: flagellar hook-basal body complex protein FliE, partial [Isosphaeraceae bacterium]|nr:flagellar hook-basal body complex protein FliE [Isosphaeraceae bacterium]
MLPGRGTPGRENTATNGRVTLEIQAISPIRIPPITPTGTATPASFEGILGRALQGLSATQARADSQAADLAAGKDVSLVDTVLAM